MNTCAWKFVRASLALGVGLACALPAMAQQWPQLREPTADAVCAKSLEIATAAFRSRRHILYSTDTVPDGAGVTLVIKPHGRDISGGHDLIVDDTAFAEIQAEGKRRSLYWQRAPRHGVAFVLSESSFSWQGDWFEFLAVPDNTKPADVQAEVDGQLRQEERTYPLLVDNEWRPPLFVRDDRTGEIWGVSVGPPYVWLSDWRVFSIGADGAKERCAIQFHPDVAPDGYLGKAWDLLPEDVRELAKLIDGTLGSGANEGTMNPTARNRNEAGHAWANAALRPWVYAGADTQRLRADTDALLESWSLAGPSYARHYRKIVRQLPRAEAALADLYRSDFGMSDDAARSVARAAVDIAIRANYGQPVEVDCRWATQAAGACSAR